jgi:hypothetical protein
MGWRVWRWNPGGPRFSAPVQTGPGAHPAFCTKGTGSFPGVQSGQGVTLAPHFLLAPGSRKTRSIPLLPLWAVRPVQSLSACTRVRFTFNFIMEVTSFLLKGMTDFTLSRERCVDNRFFELKILKFDMHLHNI